MLAIVELNTSVVIFKCNEEYIKDTLFKLNPAFDIGDTNEKLIDEYTSTLTSWVRWFHGSILESKLFYVIVM
jgi:hypothetical protein